jgi:hypothetical protein
MKKKMLLITKKMMTAVGMEFRAQAPGDTSTGLGHKRAVADDNAPGLPNFADRSSNSWRIPGG